MARDGKDDDWRRRRDREDEAEAEEAERKRLKHGIPTQGGSHSKQDSQAPNTDSLDLLLGRADVLINQIDHLYNMYFAGVETLPPVDKRNLLETTIKQIENTPKPTPSLNFKAGGLLSRFISYREKWDRKLKDLESGKLRRG